MKRQAIPGTNLLNACKKIDKEIIYFKEPSKMKPSSLSVKEPSFNKDSNLDKERRGELDKEKNKNLKQLKKELKHENDISLYLVIQIILENSKTITKSAIKPSERSIPTNSWKITT